MSTPTAAARTVVPDHAVVTRSLASALASVRRRGSDHVSRRVRDVGMLKRRLDGRSPAELVILRRGWIAQLVARNRQRMSGMVTERTGRLAMQVRGLATVHERVSVARLTIDRDRRQLARSAGSCISLHAARHATAVGRLRALGPAATLERGYAIVRRVSDSHVVRSVHGAQPHDAVTITLADGSLAATIDDQEA